MKVPTCVSVPLALDAPAGQPAVVLSLASGMRRSYCWQCRALLLNEPGGTTGNGTEGVAGSCADRSAGGPRTPSGTDVTSVIGRMVTPLRYWLLRARSVALDSFHVEGTLCTVWEDAAMSVRGGFRGGRRRSGCDYGRPFVRACRERSRPALRRQRYSAHSALTADRYM